MSAEMLEKAFASSAGVLAQVQSGDLDKATPCASWKVRDLINHMVGGTYFFAVTAETGLAPTGDTGTDFTAGDVVATYKEGAARAIAAFRADGAMEKVMKLPFGEFPGAMFINIATTDAFAHGWDLAKALGAPTDLDGELAAQLLASGMIPDAFRGADGQAPFGPKVDVAESAPAADRLAGYLGRTP
jgi:uncharacterized protein (TIGR03086 family)